MYTHAGRKWARSLAVWAMVFASGHSCCQSYRFLGCRDWNVLLDPGADCAGYPWPDGQVANANSCESSLTKHCSHTQYAQYALCHFLTVFVWVEMRNLLLLFRCIVRLPSPRVKTARRLACWTGLLARSWWRIPSWSFARHPRGNVRRRYIESVKSEPTPSQLPHFPKLKSLWPFWFWQRSQRLSSSRWRVLLPSQFLRCCEVSLPPWNLSTSLLLHVTK